MRVTEGGAFGGDEDPNPSDKGGDAAPNGNNPKRNADAENGSRKENGGGGAGSGGRKDGAIEAGRNNADGCGSYGVNDGLNGGSSGGGGSGDDKGKVGLNDRHNGSKNDSGGGSPKQKRPEEEKDDGEERATKRASEKPGTSKDEEYALALEAEQDRNHAKKDEEIAKQLDKELNGSGAAIPETADKKKKREAVETKAAVRIAKIELRFREDFPHGYPKTSAVKHNVSGASLYCGPRAVIKSMWYQCPSLRSILPTVEDLVKLCVDLKVPNEPMEKENLIQLRGYAKTQGVATADLARYRPDRYVKDHQTNNFSYDCLTRALRQWGLERGLLLAVGIWNFKADGTEPHLTYADVEYGVYPTIIWIFHEAFHYQGLERCKPADGRREFKRSELRAILIKERDRLLRKHPEWAEHWNDESVRIPSRVLEQLPLDIAEAEPADDAELAAKRRRLSPPLLQDAVKRSEGLHRRAIVELFFDRQQSRRAVDPTANVPGQAMTRITGGVATAAAEGDNANGNGYNDDDDAGEDNGNAERNNGNGVVGGKGGNESGCGNDDRVNGPGRGKDGAGGSGDPDNSSDDDRDTSGSEPSDHNSDDDPDLHMQNVRDRLLERRDRKRDRKERDEEDRWYDRWCRNGLDAEQIGNRYADKRLKVDAKRQRKRNAERANETAQKMKEEKLKLQDLKKKYLAQKVDFRYQADMPHGQDLIDVDGEGLAQGINATLKSLELQYPGIDPQPTFEVLQELCSDAGDNFTPLTLANALHAWGRQDRYNLVVGAWNSPTDGRALLPLTASRLGLRPSIVWVHRKKDKNTELLEYRGIRRIAPRNRAELNEREMEASQNGMDLAAGLAIETDVEKAVWDAVPKPPKRPAGGPPHEDKPRVGKRRKRRTKPPDSRVAPLSAADTDLAPCNAIRIMLEFDSETKQVKIGLGNEANTVLPGTKFNDDGTINVNIPIFVETVEEPPFLADGGEDEEEEVGVHDKEGMVEGLDEAQFETKDAAVQEAAGEADDEAGAGLDEDAGDEGAEDERGEA